MPSQADSFHPKLRPLDIKRVGYQGMPFFLLRDPVGLNESQLLIPETLGPLLALCDGTREIAALSSAVKLHAGIDLPERQVAEVVRQLSEALFLEDDRYAAAMARAEAAYRTAPFRIPSLAGRVYPADPAALDEAFQGYCRESGVDASADHRDSVVGVISPHIDYQRGGLTYAAVWQQAASAIRASDLVIVFGTDHCGGPGKLTLTRQSYATPWGVLPTPSRIVERLGREIGPGAFAEELHHRNEHSIELALVWLHYFARPRSREVLPILCGSFHEFVEGRQDPESYMIFERVIAALKEETAGRRVLVIAAADLAHVGPAFGDPAPFTAADRQDLHATDHSLLAAIGDADHRRFFEEIRRAGDRRRICGMPPIYMTLRLLGTASGETFRYDQCPADDDGGSLVSIAGAVLRRRT